MKNFMLAPLLCISGVFASNMNNNINEECEATWAGAFRLPNGLVVRHSPDYIEIGSLRLQRFREASNAPFNRCQAPRSIDSATKKTPAEFLEDLRKAGLYDYNE